MTIVWSMEVNVLCALRSRLEFFSKQNSGALLLGQGRGGTRARQLPPVRARATTTIMFRDLETSGMEEDRVKTWI